MGNACELLNIEHCAAGIWNGFAEEQLGVGAEGSLYLIVRGIGMNKRAVDAKLFKRYCKEVERSAVYLAWSNEVVARLADVKHGIEVGSLSARGENCRHAAF